MRAGHLLTDPVTGEMTAEPVLVPMIAVLITSQAGPTLMGVQQKDRYLHLRSACKDATRDQAWPSQEQEFM